MDDSPLGRLPAELRNHIYEPTLCFPQPITLQYRKNRRPGKGMPPGARSKPLSILVAANSSRHPLALTATCRRVRGEALPVFYAQNDFRFHSDRIIPFSDISNLSPLFEWLKAIDPVCRRLIRRLDLAIWMSGSNGLLVNVADHRSICNDLSHAASFFTNTQTSLYIEMDCKATVHNARPGSVPECAKHLHFMLRRSELEDFVRIQFVEQVRDLWRQFKDREISRELFAVRQAELQDRRRRVEPIFRLLILQLRDLEEFGANPLDATIARKQGLKAELDAAMAELQRRLAASGIVLRKTVGTK